MRMAERRALSLFMVLSLFAGACSQDPGIDRWAGKQAGAAKPGPPTGGPAVARASAIRAAHLPDVELITQDGKIVRFYEDLVRGRVVAINFMFASCRNACPVATHILSQVQASLAGRDVTFLSVTLDPLHDTPELLKRYADRHGVRSGWYFLTGRPADIEVLRKKLGAYDPDPVLDADPAQHSGIVILGNEPAGRWKAIPALSRPVRIRQALDRTINPPSEWPIGEGVVNEGTYEEREVIETPDLASLPILE